LTAKTVLFFGIHFSTEILGKPKAV